MTHFSETESIKIQKEAEDLYEKYNIEVNEYSQKEDHTLSQNKDSQSVLTIKLSNSTTPMACL